MGLAKPAKDKINCSVKTSYISFYEDKEYCTVVIYVGEEAGGKMRSKVHVGPTVLIQLNNTTTHKLQYVQFYFKQRSETDS